jgi:hypothetical protein
MLFYLGLWASVNAANGKRAEPQIAQIDADRKESKVSEGETFTQ